ncbi:MAG: hypothetical protein ACR2H7_07745 [Actinomycetota bacterium]
MFAFVAVIMLSACDGAMSSQEFTAEANRICAQTEDAIEELGGDATEQQDPRQFAEVATEELNELLDELRELEAPTESSGDFNTMLERLDAAIGDIIPLADAVGNSVENFDPETEDENQANIEAVREINERLSQNLEEANDAATAIDLDECAATATAPGDEAEEGP